MAHFLLVAFLVFAAGGSDEGEWKELSGKLHHIDHQKKSIAIENAQAPGQKVILQVESSTTILIDGQLSALDELPRGTEVRASFREGKEKHRAQWIEVQRIPTQKAQSRDAISHPTAPQTPVKQR